MAWQQMAAVSSLFPIYILGIHVLNQHAKKDKVTVNYHPKLKPQIFVIF